MSGEEVAKLITEAAREGASSLDLSRKGLTVLPPSIGKLKNLRKLYLEENKIKSLPPEMMSLVNLTELNLRGNPIPIPPEILGRRYLPDRKSSNPSSLLSNSTWWTRGSWKEATSSLIWMRAQT